MSWPAPIIGNMEPQGIRIAVRVSSRARSASFDGHGVLKQPGRPPSRRFAVAGALSGRCFLWYDEKVYPVAFLTARSTRRPRQMLDIRDNRVVMSIQAEGQSPVFTHEHVSGESVETRG